MQTILGAGLLIAALILVWQYHPVVAEKTPEPSVLENPLPPIKTESRFAEKLSTQSASISKNIVYKDDPETEAGIDIVVDEGKDGQKITTTKITYYQVNTSGVGFDSPEVKQNKEYSREVIDTQVIPAKDKIILRGTKIVWRTLATPDGEIRYWKKMRVWATHYDSHCLGCNDQTAIGLKAGHGVIAVDPTVIKLRSRVYIPGYGVAVAGDVGGAVKGNMIDLGFDDARTAGWSAKFTDIYLLN